MLETTIAKNLNNGKAIQIRRSKTNERQSGVNNEKLHTLIKYNHETLGKGKHCRMDQ